MCLMCYQQLVLSSVAWDFRLKCDLHYTYTVSVMQIVSLLNALQSIVEDEKMKKSETLDSETRFSPNE